MKNLRLKRSFRKAKCVMELGKHYRIYGSFGNRVYADDCTLIRTGKKGFNLLSMDRYKCLLKRNVYHADSAKGRINKDQTVFEIVLPDWISRVEAFDDSAPTKIAYNMEDREQDIEAEEARKTTNMKNALYRMEL